jgi:hypothetical protein
VLDYGGQKSQQSLKVSLDPRIHATQADLQARLALDQKIHSDLDALDKEINQALAVRDKLNQAAPSPGTIEPQAAKVLATLNHDIDTVAQLKTKGSEGDLLYGTRLRDHLAYLAADIELSYGRPTAAQEAVFKQLDQKAKQGQQKLQDDVAQANKAVARAAGPT